MKFNKVKLIIAIAIALLLGFICEIIAPETDGRNWISLAVGTITIVSVLLPAMGINYDNAKRGVSIKVFAWIMVVVLTIANIVFACFEYKTDIYIVVCLLLAVVGWGIVYALYSAKTAE
jgi:hypothetical protein